MSHGVSVPKLIHVRVRHTAPKGSVHTTAYPLNHFAYPVPQFGNRWSMAGVTNLFETESYFKEHALHPRAELDPLAGRIRIYTPVPPAGNLFGHSGKWMRRRPATRPQTV
ncbi:unnamed protein product [Pleuronectes platessa]|uniref:Uncharacterized protein n=1 Tax=Pleuronectes platessa TaxID=8262 RepID=A0A9N7V159_PLEPL|nr:unnamed protein product [Pleuronectes platessa]